MSQILFDAPGPRARRRHRIYAAIFLLVLAAFAVFVVQRLRAEEVLAPEVFEEAYSDNNIDFMLEGLVATLRAAAVATLTSIVFGAILAVGRLSEHRFFRLPCTLVIEFFRAVPLVLLIIFFFYFYSFEDQSTDTFVALVTGLTLYNGAVLAEVFRAGVNAVARGQSEAAYAIGMRKTQVMSIVLMPQAVAFMLPAIISQCVIVLKDTALGQIIGYHELVDNSVQITLFVNNGSIVVYGTAAAIFIVINYSLSKLAQYLERRLARRGQGKAVEEVESVVVDTGA
jgi:glutamate transport system permease protein